jgi:hypothetical protein
MSNVRRLVSPSFKLVDWILGLALLGGASVALMVALLSGRKWLAAFAVPIAMFTIGVAVSLGIDFAMQHRAVEEFFRGGSHKRNAMRTFLPWSLGLVVGAGSMAAWALLRERRWKRWLQQENPVVFAKLFPLEGETPNPSIERTLSGLRPPSASHVKR